MYDSIFVLRYMGNKNKLLKYIIPEIEAITEPGDTVCDLMAGTNVIGYALKKRNRIISNDIQYYSYVIGKALIENNNEIINESLARKELFDSYKENLKHFYYDFFKRNYADTYFSKRQCMDIDSIRYAIEQLDSEYKRMLYLCSLMSVMCKVQSTPGHFAQYMPKNHPRIIPLRAMDVWELFIKKSNDFNELVMNRYRNIALNLDYKELFKKDIVKEIKCFYLDSPYTTEQYSRFYHILETVTKYDSPEIRHKGLYRNDRYKSKFCYKKFVEQEFRNILGFVASINSKLVISYSNKGLISIERLRKIAYEYFNEIRIVDINYSHSTQGKGNKLIKEYIFILQ